METKVNQRDVQGSKQGFWEEYYSNGNLWSKGSYLDDKETGAWEWYYYNGNFCRKGSYLDGIEIGTWETYDREGILIEVTYHH